METRKQIPMKDMNSTKAGVIHINPHTLKVIGPFVLTKVDSLTYESVIIKGRESNIEIKIDASFNTENHVARIGTVAALPGHLRMDNGHRFMPWEVDMELEIGDEIFFNFDSVARVINGTDPLYIHGDEVYIMVHYSTIVAAKRGGNLLILNGYCLVEPVTLKEEDEIFYGKSNIITPDYISKHPSHRIGIIRYVGSPIKRYLSGTYEEPNVKPGDKILYKDKLDISIEYELHRKFSEIKNLFKLQRRFMYAELD